MVHIYCGDGKGKTTAAVGLALRAAGAGKRVVFTQFYKDGSSSEIRLLRQIPSIRVLVCPTHYGFYRRMTQEQRERARQSYTALLEQALSMEADVLILDEAVSASRNGSIPEARLLEYLPGAKPEVVLTGRNPSPELMALADYITEMKKQKHPFDRGIPARKGIEF